MSQICWLDILIALPLLIGFIRGLMRGLVTEFIAITAVILGCVGAKIWGATISAWLQAQFTWPQPVCDVTSYALLFIAIALALNMLGRLFTRLLSAIHLGFLNRLLGAVFGTLKWSIIVLTLVFLVDKLDSQFRFMQEELKQKSITYQPAVKTANACLSFIRSELGQQGTNH